MILQRNMDVDVRAIIAAAEAGGKVIRDYFGKVLEVQEKSSAADFRTQADTESEKIILSLLKEKFPEYNIFSEESGLIDNRSEYTFVIDPLDGSNNFVLGIPYFSVSIGLLRKDAVLAGVVHVPMLGDTYHAERGKGAFLNDIGIFVSKEVDLMRATISYVAGYNNHKEHYKDVLQRDIPVKRNLFNWSSAADYCLLASGKIEAVVSNKTEVHDFVAGKLIAREAGAVITDFSGQPEISDKNDQFIASNNAIIHQQLLRTL